MPGAYLVTESEIAQLELEVLPNEDVLQLQVQMCYSDTPMQVLHCLHEGLEQVLRKFLSENEWLGDSILLSNLLEQLEHV